jgi:hypothetical protein
VIDLELPAGRFVGWNFEERVRHCVVQLAKRRAKVSEVELPAEALSSIEYSAGSGNRQCYDWSGESLTLVMLGMRISLVLRLGDTRTALFKVNVPGGIDACEVEIL